LFIWLLGFCQHLIPYVLFVSCGGSMLLFKQTLAFLSLTLVCLLSAAFEVDHTVYVTKDVSNGVPGSRLLSPTERPKVLSSAFSSMRLGGVELIPAKIPHRKQTR
jgi:hypothetical protein